MKKTLSLIIFLLATISVSAQQSIKSNQIADFHSVSLSGNLNAELIRADVNSVDIELYNSDINKFKWSVNDGVLSVSLRPTIGSKARADVRIYYRGSLSDISVIDARLSATEAIMSHMMRLVVSGGANVNATVDVKDLEVEVTGNSSLLMSGTAKYLTLKATERSKVDVRKMQAVSAETEAATGAEVYVNSSERLVANARIAATIFYTGNPTIFKDRSSKINTSLGSSVLSIGHKE